MRHRDQRMGILLTSFAAVLALTMEPSFDARLGADDVVPHAQDKPPGPALSPAEAIAKMIVPEGFTVELVASEPDIVNPVAMTFDERGRIWITESLEYPRREPGPGRDRVKILEDTDGDGKADKFTIFADGLNIPSGIAVGGGGVWVANSPDILFLEDTNGDDQADKQRVVVTGFGREDTHELPNSLTWGPDGWLYGLNGVFNPASVKQGDKQFDFTCALFRIHPKTWQFELFCEGTSNPWGVAWDSEGSAFVSACVIDHLWHLSESGYYLRQGGPYPPFTSIIGSIVKHKHQKAAYCGIHYFDSDAYPAAYRGRLFMGNIHGNCVNVDKLSRDGSTYFATGEPDFLSANDAWFMPVVQKTGPDGCLYILDWYDRYHCYQDANRDPAGIDRAKGRLYRVRYKNTPRAKPFDLAKESDESLINRLKSPNVFYRDLSQRLLAERDHDEARAKLERLVLDASVDRRARLHGLWSLVGTGRLDASFHQSLLAHSDATFRAWGVRAAGNFGKIDRALASKVQELAADPSADVRLQVAIAARKIEGLDPLPILLAALDKSGEDKLIPHIVWQNLHPLLEDRSEELLKRIEKPKRAPALAPLMPRVIDRVLGRRSADPAPIVALVQMLLGGEQAEPAAAQRCLAKLAEKVQNREITGEQLAKVKQRLEAAVKQILGGAADEPLYLDAALLAASWNDASALEAVEGVLFSPSASLDRRRQAIDALVAARAPALDAVVQKLLADRAAPLEVRSIVLGSLGRADEAWVSTAVLANYAKMEAELQPKAIELLTQRSNWAIDLLAAIGRKELPATALNVNQVRKLLESKDEKLARIVRSQWGSVRTGRNPQREQVIRDMRTFIRRNPGDAKAGQAVFQKICGQCHKIYGEGQEVGPDITVNGRSSFEQLLSNVFDPSLVIGASYQARTVVTADGRVLTGLLTEDNDQRVVLKTQGGKLETIARADVEEMKVSELSLMPEELEKQLKSEEIADLFAYITLDKPPSDPTARQLPGVRELMPQQTSDENEFPEIMASFAPGFSVRDVGEGGLGVVAEHFLRPSVVRTHPATAESPAIFSGRFTLPKDKNSRLALAVSHHPQGDWRLVVKANGQIEHDSIVAAKTTIDGWLELSIDLTKFTGESVDLELRNEANGWSYEYGYWGRIEIISE